jgi:hypothetical protein
MSSNFRQELIDSVDPAGRPLYAATLNAISSVTGREGEITAIGLRVIKGIQQLQLKAAMLTKEGIATSDGVITDCSAAMVQNKNGQWQRYSGKDSANPTRLFSSYSPDSKEFSIWAEGADASIIQQPKTFHASVLGMRDGERIEAKMHNGLREGVLEEGPLSEHIRQCLSHFEKDVERIGILLRHPAAPYALSDTRTPRDAGIRAIYSDGSQMHAMNRNTILDWQNASIERKMTMASYRAGIEIGGEEMLPNIEDLIYEIRIRTQAHGEVPLQFTGLTPRCLVTQRDVRSGAIHAEPKTWNRKHRPIRLWDKHVTMGANVDMPPEFDGSIIRVGDRFSVTTEKVQWRQ